METITDPDSTGTKNNLVTILKCLLADEYVLMNKTSNCLLDPSSPFVNEKTSIFQKTYYELKKIVEAISEAIKHKSNKLSISINDILGNTHLKNTTVFESKVAAIEMLLDDHLTILKHVRLAIEKFELTNDEEIVDLLENISIKHTSICSGFNNYLKEIFNYKTINYDEKSSG